jgi:probable rRNA maturation factor
MQNQKEEAQESPIISFHIEEIEFSLDHADDIISWIEQTLLKEQKQCNLIDFVICDDEYLLNINKEYLQHDYYTDIITFPLNEDPIESNVFISIDRVKENAQLYKVKMEDELHRVIIHGVLHLIGYDDKSEDDKNRMRAKEDEYLSQRNFS